MTAETNTFHDRVAPSARRVAGDSTRVDVGIISVFVSAAIAAAILGYVVTSAVEIIATWRSMPLEQIAQGPAR